MIELDWRDLLGILGALLVVVGLAWAYLPAAVVAVGAGLLVAYYLLEKPHAVIPGPLAPPAQPPFDE